MKITQVDLYEGDVPDRPWAWSDEVFEMPGHREDRGFLVVVRTDALALHVCSAAPGPTRPHDIVGFWAQEDDCVQEDFPVVEGIVTVPSGPGLGVTLDDQALERYGGRS